jgi:hypothetical protein
MLTDWLNERRARRLEEGDAVECGFRVVVGEHPGLSRRWIHGVARLAPGEIILRRSLGLGLRIPRPLTAPVQITVTSVASDDRSTHGQEAWAVNVNTRIVKIHAGQAVLEWAVPLEQQRWALSRVACTGDP